MPMPLPIGRRDIQALAVKCANVEGGCEWSGTVGTLEEHLAKCKFTLVLCPNKCKADNGKVNDFLRKDLDKHLEETCPNRPDVCKHCGVKGMFADIQIHDKTCTKKNVACPNCNKSMCREDTEEHIDTECLFSEIPCKFASIGCNFRMQRKDMSAHEDGSLHLHMALNAVVELKAANAELKAEQKQFKAELNTANAELKADDNKLKAANVEIKAELKATKAANAKMKEELKADNDKLRTACVQLQENGRTKTFALSKYAKKKESNEIFVSPSFHTSPSGYRMAVRVDPNGFVEGKGTHVCMHWKEKMTLNWWPFTGC